jgi:signal recognition particle GTPase
VNRVLKQFDQMRKMMQMVTNTSKMNMMMNAMRGKMPGMPQQS